MNVFPKTWGSERARRSGKQPRERIREAKEKATVNPLPSFLNKTNVMAFISRYKLQLITIAAVGGVLCAYHVYQREKPFPDWEGPSVRSVDSQPTKPISLPDTENVSRANFYDPDAPEVDPRYKLPTKLTSSELHQFILNLECLVDFCRARDQLLTDYNLLYQQLTDPKIKDAFLLRIRNQQGFKHANLSIEWQEFSNTGPFIVSVPELQTLYVMNRVGIIRSRIIGATYMPGDMAFVDYATHSYIDDLERLAAWVKKASLLQEWLVEDSVITRDSALSTSIDKFDTISQLIDLIRRRHADPPQGGPQKAEDTRQVVALQYDWNSPTGQVQAELGEAERQQLVTLVDRECLAILNQRHFSSTGNNENQSAVIPIMNLWSFMIEPERRQPSVETINIAPLEAQRRDYFLRKSMLRQIGDNLQNALKHDSMDDSVMILGIYESAMQTRVAQYDNEMAPFKDMIASLGSDDAHQVRFTVGQVKKIKSTWVWLDATLQKYAAQEQKMDQLLVMLRGAKNPILRRLVLRYKFDEGVVDPFSSSPMRIFENGHDPGLLLPGFTLPKIKVVD
jgi:hypothetical protein